MLWNLKNSSFAFSCLICANYKDVMPAFAASFALANFEKHQRAQPRHTAKLRQLLLSKTLRSYLSIHYATINRNKIDR